VIEASERVAKATPIPIQELDDDNKTATNAEIFLNVMSTTPGGKHSQPNHHTAIDMSRNVETSALLATTTDLETPAAGPLPDKATPPSTPRISPASEDPPLTIRIRVSARPNTDQSKHPPPNHRAAVRLQKKPLNSTTTPQQLTPRLIRSATTSSQKGQGSSPNPVPR